ncbi:hypothetical protein C5167_035722 [Papaver somniferum]|nr:hypothetical protein C5167_035722 [Papaver somniferum]
MPQPPPSNLLLVNKISIPSRDERISRSLIARSKVIFNSRNRFQIETNLEIKFDCISERNLFRSKM